MIIKNKSFCEKFVNWWNDYQRDKPLITGSANDMIYSISILLFVILAAFV